MQRTEVVKEARVGKEDFQDLDLAALAKKTFSMYGGRDEEVVLLCKNEIAGVIMDRFGSETMLVPVDGEHFKVHILVAVSRQFFGWVTGIGKSMYIAGPEHVQKEYREYLLDILDGY